VRASQPTNAAGSDEQGKNEAAKGIPHHRLPVQLQVATPEALVLVLTLLLVLPVYLLTMPTDLTWAFHSADGAELITAAVTLGVPHPPGYPAYVLLGKLISLLPFGTVAFRFNLLSSLLMSGAAALTASAAYRWVIFHSAPSMEPESPNAEASSRHRQIWAALTMGLTFAFLPLVWQQALVAEVYALQLFLLAALLLTLFGKGGKGRDWLSGLLLGLAITGHLTSLLVLPLVLFLTDPSRWRRLLAGFIIGLSPFLLVPLLALGDSPVVWGNATTLDGWWWLVSAQIYQPNVLSLTPTRWLPRLATWASEPSFLYLLGAFILLIIYTRISANSNKNVQRLALLCTLAFAIYAFFYDSLDATVYLLPALLLITILSVKLAEYSGRALLLLPLALLVLNFNAVNTHAQAPVRSTIEEVLHHIPENAMLITTGDRATFSLWYLKHVEGYRPDLIIVDANLFAFDWYRQRLARTYTGLERLEKDDLVAFQTANSEEHPWCTFEISSGSPPERTLTCIED
jgi:hypothetical protein